jgi:hypothetical protein
MHIGILNTPRFRNTRNQQQIACLEARQLPNTKSTLNNSRFISRASYLQSAYNSHRFQRKISVKEYNTCDNNANKCGVYPYPNKQIPIEVNQFGVFVGGKTRMPSNF